MNNKPYMQSHKGSTPTPFVASRFARFDKVKTMPRKVCGFTLIETLVGVTILLFSITATLSMISTNIRFSGAAREEMTASFLAQEALEIVRNIRDNNMYKNKNWLNGLTKCFNSLCYLDATETRLNDIVKACGTQCPLLKLSNQDNPSQPSVYQYIRGTDTIYRREVAINKEVNKVSIQVSATVYWTRGILEKSMTINEYIYNWQGNMKE